MGMMVRGGVRTVVLLIRLVGLANSRQFGAVLRSGRILVQIQFESMDYTLMWHTLLSLSSLAVALSMFRRMFHSWCRIILEEFWKCLDTMLTRARILNEWRPRCLSRRTLRSSTVAIAERYRRPPLPWFDFRALRPSHGQ